MRTEGKVERAGWTTRRPPIEASPDGERAGWPRASIRIESADRTEAG